MKPQRVLVVDDNRDAADTLRMMLDCEGHETTVAYTGAAAIDEAIRFRPGIVFLDIGLPDMDGYEVARKMRASPEGASMRLVALTGYGQPEDRARALHEGFDMHLIKPMDAANLRKIVAASSD